MMSTCFWQLENAMAEHRDPLPSTDVDEPIPKRRNRSHEVSRSTEANEPTPKTAPGHVSHTVSPASLATYIQASCS